MISFGYNPTPYILAFLLIKVPRNRAGNLLFMTMVTVFAVEADEGTAPLVLPGVDECTTELSVIQGPSITILAKPRED